MTAFFKTYAAAILGLIIGITLLDGNRGTLVITQVILVIFMGISLCQNRPKRLLSLPLPVFYLIGLALIWLLHNATFYDITNLTYQEKLPKYIIEQFIFTLGIFTLSQKFQPKNIHQLLLGLHTALIGFITAALVGHHFDITSSIRLTGFGEFSLNPNITGLLCVFALALNIVCLRNIKMNKRLNYALLLTFFPIFYAIILTGSRGALLTSVLCLGIYAVQTHQKYLVYKLTAFAIGFAGVFYLASAYIDNLFIRALAFRDVIWLEAIARLTTWQDWLFGKGLSYVFGFEYGRHMHPHPHNLYLSLVVYGGLLSLMAMGIMVAYIVKNSPQQVRPYYLLALPIAVGGLVDFYAFASRLEFMWLTLWFPLALYLGLCHNKHFKD